MLYRCIGTLKNESVYIFVPLGQITRRSATLRPSKNDNVLFLDPKSVDGILDNKVGVLLDLLGRAIVILLLVDTISRILYSQHRHFELHFQ